MMERTLIIAEAGVNHDGDIQKALRLVEIAAEAGADVVKFQTFSAGKVISRLAEKAAYQKRTTGAAESQLDMVRKLELSPDAHGLIAQHCNKVGIEFMSTPFDIDSAHFLSRTIGVSRLKVPSGEITNLPFLHQLGTIGLPIILSTGASTMDEVAEALSALAAGYAGVEVDDARFIERYGAENPTLPILVGRARLLHCTSEYPSPPEDANLNAMTAMRARFGLPVGLSDHTTGISIPTAAVAMGADCIEKHFTLDRSLPGPDHKASLEPAELAEMVAAIRAVEVAKGDGVKRPSASERANLTVIRRSLVADRAIRRGEAFDAHNLALKRPAGGLAPRHFWRIVGLKASRDYQVDEMIGAEELAQAANR
jgi:N-acetylneuraminate synthase